MEAHSGAVDAAHRATETVVWASRAPVRAKQWLPPRDEAYNVSAVSEYHSYSVKILLYSVHHYSKMEKVNTIICFFISSRYITHGSPFLAHKSGFSCD